MSDEVQVIEPKSLNLFQKLWEKIPATWPQFFWSLLWAFLLVHPIAIIYYFMNDFLMCGEKTGSSSLCFMIQLHWVCLPLLVPCLVSIKILLKSFSLPALLKTGLAISLTILFGFVIFGYSMVFLLGFVYIFLALLQG